MTGLLLVMDNEKDREAFQTFIDKWKEANGCFFRSNNGTYEEADEFMDELCIGVELVAKDGSTLSCGYFEECTIADVHFIPSYRTDGSLNVRGKNSDVITPAETIVCYDTDYFAIKTLYDTEIPALFAEGNKRYETPDEIIEEFKDRVGKYFPEDFDWKRHIGHIHFNFTYMDS